MPLAYDSVIILKKKHVNMTGTSESDCSFKDIKPLIIGEHMK